MVTFGGAEWERGRFSKIRARQSVENEQGYNFISGFYMLGPKLRPASGPYTLEKGVTSPGCTRSHATSREPQHDQSSNILPRFRELLTNIQDQ